SAMWTGVSPYAVNANGKGGSVFTVSGLNITQYYANSSNPGGNPVNKGDTPNSAIESYAQDNSEGGWTYNVDNVNLTGPQGVNGSASQQPLHLLNVEGSYVILSGTVTAGVRTEMVQASKVDIANGANVTGTLVNGTSSSGYSMIFFSNWSPNQSQKANSTGADHQFTMGNGATITGVSPIAQTARNNSYPLVFGSYQGITTGDNVTWNLIGYTTFLNQGMYNGSFPNNRNYIFGRNFTMNAYGNIDNTYSGGQPDPNAPYQNPGQNFITTNDGSNANIYFYPGLNFKINQINGAKVIALGAGTTMTVNAPKYFDVGAFDYSWSGSYKSSPSGADLYPVSCINLRGFF
ncbi:hypothetical protein, partial [Fructobacillus ficulneus]